MEHAHILVVDDSEITGFKLKAILIRLGYTVSTFTNPIKALDWLRNPANIADLILTDVNMPEMNGVDLVKSLRRLPGHASTPVIMLTSNTEMEDKIAGLQAGADDYLGKTVSPTELELRVKALLARNQSKETNFSQSVARTITVFSPRGGVGTSTLAVNLSIALAQLWNIDVCLWDMALSSGHCAPLLNLKPKNTLSFLNNWPEGQVDDQIMNQMLMKHSGGILFMPAPLSSADAELVTPAIVDQVWTYLQGNSSYLVIDAGNHFTEPVLNILERSDVILMVLSPELLSVKSTGDALDVFEKMGFDLQKILLVINQTFQGFKLPTKKILPVLHNRPAVEIPHDSDRFIEAILTGEPPVINAPRSEASMAIFALAYTISSPQMENKKKTSSPMLDTIRRFIKEI